jgi:hypothetical protein
MKNIFLTVFLTFFISNVYAINLGDVLKDVGRGSGKSINKKLDKKIDKVVKKFEGKIDIYKVEMDSEIKKYKAQIKEAEDTLNKIKDIKDSAEFYISKARLILGILSSGILALLFVMWRIWRNILTMKKVIKNVANYDDIEKRLNILEGKINVG